MKKNLLLCALCAIALISCKSKNEPSAAYQVAFRVPELITDMEPMKAPAATILDDEDGQALTDLYLFDGTTQLAHQTSSEDGFGTITVQLLAGEHNLHFVATRASGLSYADGVLSMTAVRPTFGQHLVLNVTGSSEQNITLDRITGQFKLTIEDEIPSTAAKLRIQIGDFYSGLNVVTFAGANHGSYDTGLISITSRQGMTNQSWTINHLAPTYGTEYNTTYTITAYDANNNAIASATGSMAMNSNTKTNLHGNLFTGTQAFISVNHAWGADINVNM